MWINKGDKMQGNLKYIMIGKTEGGKKLSFEEYFVKPITLWAILNPSTQIVIWYDSEMLNQSINNYTIALQNTINACKESVAKYGINPDNIIFRDIRDISIVNKYWKYLNERIDISVRIDILRIIVSYYVVAIENKGKTVTFTYTDFSFNPITKSELFNENTLKGLSEFGLVLVKQMGSIVPYENGFFMLSNIAGNYITATTLQCYNEIFIKIILEYYGEIMFTDRSGFYKEQYVFETYKYMILYSIIENNLFQDLSMILRGKKVVYYNKFNEIDEQYKVIINKDDVNGEKSPNYKRNLILKVRQLKPENCCDIADIEYENFTDFLRKKMSHIFKENICTWRQSSYGVSKVCIKPMPDLPPISKT